MSWFEVRLAFPDGAFVDALAVVSEGCVCVEDVRARPALTREDLIALGDWIQRPLLDAVGAEAAPSVREGAAPPEPPALGVPVEVPVCPPSTGPVEQPPVTLAEVTPGVPLGAPAVVPCEPAVQVPAEVPVAVPADAPADLSAPDAATPDAATPALTTQDPEAPASTTPAPGVPDADAGAETVDSPSAGAGSRRARPAWPRGAEGCRLAAREYRAAQEQGADPVLAVMCATGRSRRRSLRLIAQARDAGYLTSRHVRR